jgi:thiamine-monophosphate kinase
MADADQISETEIIAAYFALLAADTPGSFGLKDDAALIDGRFVVSMDALVAGVHFFADDAPVDIAWKALAVNVSDLIAKGAQPRAYTMALALPGKPRRDWIAAFARGLGEAQAAFDIGLLGGDTTATPGPLTIAITAFGELPPGRDAPRRDGARPGDFIYMSGTLGDAALGLKARQGALRHLSAEHSAYLTSRYLRPQPPVALARAVLEHASASMDISDGLIIDLTRLCAASGCGAQLEAAAIPLSGAARAVTAANPAMLETILTGGDDYETLACIPPARERAFQEAAAAFGVQATRLGAITAGAGVQVIGPEGAPLSFRARGYEHFE